VPAPHPAGRELQALVKAWRSKFFVFLEDRRVGATNNAAEREIRPSVVFRKGEARARHRFERRAERGFRSPWGPTVHAGYRSVTSTARLAGQSAFGAIRSIADTLFRPTVQTA
jgi:transposase